MGNSLNLYSVLAPAVHVFSIYSGQIPIDKRHLALHVHIFQLTSPTCIREVAKDEILAHSVYGKNRFEEGILESQKVELKLVLEKARQLFLQTTSSEAKMKMCPR